MDGDKEIDQQRCLNLILNQDLKTFPQNNKQENHQ